MRALKFRQFINGRFHYWGILGEGHFVAPANLKDTSDQFTGLFSKDGKEIWEGDVVKCGDWKMVVEFIHGAFRWKCNDGWTNECASANGNMQIVEVIGNVWENPELLIS